MKSRVPLSRALIAVVVGLGLVVALLGPTQPRIARTAATLPEGFVDIQIVGAGLSRPTAMAFAPDGRIFVAEQGGALRVVENGQLLATPFLTVTVDDNGERGLLGVAFDPDFAANQYVYVYYTATTPSVHNRVSRFTASGNAAVLGSEVTIVDLDDLTAVQRHNGGALHFGLDGKLYIATGENGDGANAQSLDNLLGKVLRINPDGSIPADNPFYNTATGVNRAIWALGLRNPFTVDIQPGTGRIFINDVGEASWEEINDGIAGSNYGWPATEGYTSNPAYRSPLYAYAHGGGSTTGCAITGGAFYNPALNQFPAGYTGDYFFADLCSGWIRVFDPVADSVADFAAGVASPVDLKVGPDGNLYYLGRDPGVLQRITYSPPLDTDGDGCSDARELGPEPSLGGQRDPMSFWDFIDQWTGSPLGRDRVIAVGDIGAVVLRFSTSGDPTGDPLAPPAGATSYHTSADRSGAIPGQDPWDLLPPDGTIAVGDIGAVVAQFGHNCA